MLLKSVGNIRFLEVINTYSNFAMKYLKGNK